MSRLIAAFFGTILVASFFMPWFTLSMGAMEAGVSGYGILKGVSKAEKKGQTLSKVKNLFRVKVLGKQPKDETTWKLKPMPKMYFILLVPITGIVALLFSGAVRVPLITLLMVFGTLVYTGASITGNSPSAGKVKMWLLSRSDIGIGLYFTVFCMAAILVISLVQVSVREKKVVVEKAPEKPDVVEDEE